MIDPTTFHAHLDVCPQCEQHPFNLCPTGARLIREAMQPTTRFGLKPGEVMVVAEPEQVGKPPRGNR